MGWKPGKLLKKVFKGVKRTFKKIGKGIKSAFGKIGKFFGKFGVLGQIGMMMLMGPLGNMLGGILSGAMGTLGSWSAGLIQNGGWAAKALGHTMKAIHTAGTFAGKVYTTISDGIGNAVDRVGNWVSGNGFELSGDRARLFDFEAQRNNPRSLLETGEYDVVGKYGTPKTPDVVDLTKVDTVPDTSVPDTDTPDTNIDNVTRNENSNIVENDIEGILNNKPEMTPDGIKVGEVDLPTIGPEEMLDANVDVNSLLNDERSLYDTFKEDGFVAGAEAVVDAGIDRLKSTTPSQIADRVVDRVEKIPLDGITMAATQDIAKSYGWEVGDTNVNSYTLMNIPATKTEGAVYNEIDYVSRLSGNAFYGDMLRNAPSFLPETLIANNDAYAQSWYQRASNLAYENDNIHGAVYGI